MLSNSNRTMRSNRLLQCAFALVWARHRRKCCIMCKLYAVDTWPSPAGIGQIKTMPVRCWGSIQLSYRIIVDRAGGIRTRDFQLSKRSNRYLQCRPNGMNRIKAALVRLALCPLSYRDCPRRATPAGGIRTRDLSITSRSNQFLQCRFNGITSG